MFYFLKKYLFIPGIDWLKKQKMMLNLQDKYLSIHEKDVNEKEKVP